MKLLKVLFGVILLASVFFPGASLLRAQQQPDEPAPLPQEEPKPAARANPLAGTDEDNQNPENPEVDPNALQADYTPLTGMQNATLGVPQIRHSFWAPGFQYGANVQSNNYNQPGSTGWYVDNYLIGNVSLLEAWSRDTLSLNYSGGGYFSSDSSIDSGQYHQLAASNVIRFDRWLFQFFEDFSYLPQTSFGFGGGTNLGVPGVGGIGVVTPGAGNGYVPNQSILAGVGPRYSNFGGLQATYYISRRSSITVSGADGILHFLDPGNIDTDSIVASAGYNYALSRQNTIGVVYTFSAYRYPGVPEAYGNHTASFAYGRNVTGRLALRLMGGPQITTFRIPVGNQTQQISAYFNAGLVYGLKNGSIALTYFHTLNGGSGVVIGSSLDQVNVTANRRLTRLWNGNLNFGFAHNGTVNSGVTSVPTYDSYYFGGGVSRPFGRYMNMAIAYTGSLGSSNNPGCTGAGCNPSNYYNTITVNFQVHTRPFILP
jgi:hypothetical protein